MKFCTACRAQLAAEMHFCGNCGAAVTSEENQANIPPVFPADEQMQSARDAGQDTGPIPVTPQQDEINNDVSPSFLEPDFNPFEPEYSEDPTAKKSNFLFWIGLGALLILGALYYFIFIHDDRSDEGGKPVVAPPEEQIEAPKLQQLYASTIANVRDKPTTEESEIIGKLKRGDLVSGRLVSGPVEGEQWLKLEDDKGFVSVINLAENESPVLKTKFGRKTIILAAPVDLWAGPAADAELLDRLSKGLSISMSGITENGYAELILKKGGVGYIADGAKIVAAAQKADLGPAIAIKIDNNGCASGSEINALFKRITANNAAGLKKVEDANYDSEDARDAAIEKYHGRTEGKTVFVPIKRSFKGLKVTGIAQHYESQSVYFAESPGKVRSVFRSLGYKVGKDGKLPSRDIYASIDPSPRDYTRYGKTDLGCGV